MAGNAGAWHIPHVGDFLIVFRRPALARGGQRRAATPSRAVPSTDGDGRRPGARSAPGTDRSDDEVRLLRVRPKVPSPRT